MHESKQFYHQIQFIKNESLCKFDFDLGIHEARYSPPRFLCKTKTVPEQRITRGGDLGRISHAVLDELC